MSSRSEIGSERGAVGDLPSLQRSAWAALYAGWALLCK